MENALNIARKNSERDRSRQSQIDLINTDKKQLKTFISRQKISSLFDRSANHQNKKKEKEVD